MRNKLNPRTCSVEGCNKPHECLGYCPMHYSRFRRYGDPNIVTRPHRYDGVMCSIEGCERAATTRGWCTPHYKKWTRHGAPSGYAKESFRFPSLSAAPEPRFWNFVEKTETCWLWKGAINKGYGLMHVGRKNTAAHRFSFELANGPVPDGLQIDHLCRVRHCVNPAHLEAVTQQENLRRARESH